MKTHKIVCLILLTAVLGVGKRISADEGKLRPLDVRTFRDKADRAYFTANRQKKFLLLFFSSGDSRGGLVVREALQTQRLAKFSDKWIVTDTDPKRDPRGAMFAKLYRIDTYPSLIRIKTTVNPETCGVTKTGCGWQVERARFPKSTSTAMARPAPRSPPATAATIPTRRTPAWRRKPT